MIRAMPERKRFFSVDVFPNDHGDDNDNGDDDNNNDDDDDGHKFDKNAAQLRGSRSLHASPAQPCSLQQR